MPHYDETITFYDDIAEDYHLWYRNWDAELDREGLNLRRFFRERDAKTVLDASCGPGTQAIALARLGYTVIAADPSAGILARARENAAQYGVEDKITFVQSDFQNLHHHVTGPFDVVLTKGNSIPHLLRDEQIEEALLIFHELLRPGGLLLIGMALARSVLQRLPVTTSLVYLVVGVALGPYGFGLLRLDPIENATLIEHVTEVAVIISLFSAGLKLRLPWRDRVWRVPAMLAFGSMALTVGLVALVGMTVLDLSPGMAILLGAVLSPTDPVLASDVQVESVRDKDRMRFTLTAEAGLNDGSAFPFVMLGLGVLGLHDIGELGRGWLAWDVIWAVPVGLAVGAVVGTLVGRLVVYLRRRYREAVGLDDFVALGLIALAYGAGLPVDGYACLGVFAAGLALRRVERRSSEQYGIDDADPDAVADTRDPEELATRPETAPAYLAHELLRFNEQVEHIGEVAVMLLVGGMLAPSVLSVDAVLLATLLFLVIRPVAVWIGSIGSMMTRLQRLFIGWFGVRGIGSIYYLAFAIGHGLALAEASRLINLTFAVVVASIVVHGISVTPLMGRYRSWERAASD